MDQQHAPGFQGNQDFIDEVADYTAKTLGPELGEAISDDLRELPQVLTANHHGIDTFAQSTQSNLLFSMRRRADGKPAKTVPVLACASVPLNNLSFPRGLLVYASAGTVENGGACKLPIFPDSYKRKLVAIVGPFTAEMLCRSRLRAKKLIDDEKIFPSLEPALNMVFDELKTVGHEFPDYSRQATVVNHRLWRRLFREHSCSSELVYIELERITCRLLENDLFDQSAIFHQLMFDPQLRRQLVEKLDGQRGCWQSEELSRRCAGSAGGDFSDTGSTRGTMFFWGVDLKGRKLPLRIIEGQNGTGTALCGIDDSGNSWTNPFTPEGIARGLRDGRLLPSIFSSYLLVSIARGVSCIGGYYQAEYLPIMRKAVIDTLSSSAGETTKSSNTGKLHPDIYLSGMQAVGLIADDQLFPAGPLEIIASGGMDAQQYRQIGEVTVLQSHIASLPDTLKDVAPRGSNIDNSKRGITRLVHDALANKIVTISID